MPASDRSFRNLTNKFGKVIAPHSSQSVRMRNWSDMSMSSRMQDAVIQVLDRERNVRFQITVNRTWRCTVRSFWKQSQRLVTNIWSANFAGDEFSVEEIRSAMRTEVMEGSIVPVAMGSNIQAQGVANLLSDICKILPKSGLERMCRYQSQDE